MNRLHILIVRTKSAYGQSLDEETTLTGAVPGIANGKWKTSPRNVVRYITRSLADFTIADCQHGVVLLVRYKFYNF